MAVGDKFETPFEEKNERILKNRIDYWKKHQELDKFNHGNSTTLFISLIAVLSSVLVPVLIYFADKRLTEDLLFISVLFLVCFFILLGIMFFLREHNNRSFRIREAMLRNWYSQLGADTEELDGYFEKIKPYYYSRISNSELEKIAKKVMEDNLKANPLDCNPLSKPKKMSSFWKYAAMLAGVFSTIKLSKYIPIENTASEFLVSLVILVVSWWYISHFEFQ